MRHGRSAFEILLVLISVVAIALFLYGTFGSKKQSTGSAILVVDSHQVHKDLGRDLADLQTRQKEKKRLEDQLKAAQQQVQEEIAAKEAGIRREPHRRAEAIARSDKARCRGEDAGRNFQGTKNVNKNGTAISRSISSYHQTDRR